MTEGIFIQPKTEEEAISRKEQVLDRSFEDFSMDLLEFELFGSVSPRPMTEKQLDRWLKNHPVET